MADKQGWWKGFGSLSFHAVSLWNGGPSIRRMLFSITNCAHSCITPGYVIRSEATDARRNQVLRLVGGTSA
jgi:hypothetical protein